MPKFEVLFTLDESLCYYVEADDPEHAEVLGRNMFLEGEPDEGALMGWSKIVTTNVKEIPPCPAS